MDFPLEEEGPGAGIGLWCLVEEAGARLWCPLLLLLPITTRSVGVCEEDIFMCIHMNPNHYTQICKVCLENSKGAYNQNSTECNPSLNQNTSTKRL